MRLARAVALVPLVLSAGACRTRTPDLPPVDPVAYSDTIARFHQRRTAAIAGPDGWATLIGLWWLEPGANRLGSDSALEIVLPADRSPKALATGVAAADTAPFIPHRGATILTGSHAVAAPLVLHSDVEGDGKQQSVLRSGSLIISYITRSRRKAIRVKDTLAAARQGFVGHRYFPTDTAWRITARFVPTPTTDSMNIVDVLGLQTRMSWPGEPRFPVPGRGYALQGLRAPEGHGKNLFVMFRDL